MPFASRSSRPRRSRRPGRGTRRIARGAVGLLGVLALTAAACASIRIGSVTGSGVLETRSYDLSGFDSIDASQAFRVTLARGDAFAVSVTADDNLFDDIRVEVHGDRLEIGMTSNFSFRGNVTLEATVTMPELSAVDASGASRVTIGAGFAPVPRFDVNASGASRVEGALETTTLDAELSGASSLTLTGSADDLKLNASGASSFRLEDFTAARADIELSGASAANVHVTESLDRVRASGASRVRYAGSPRLGDVETSGASSISGG